MVKSIVDTIKLKNNDDPITLTKDGLELELKANVESEGFTYPKDCTKEQMKDYLKSQGWNVR